MSQPHGQSVPSPAEGIGLRSWLLAGLPLALFAALMAACLISGADLTISRGFYSAESDAWPGRESPLYRWCYEHGCKPALWVGAAGLLAALSTFFVARFRPARKPGLFLFLTLLIGPGLLVNGLFKPNLARPRPFQTAEFGGHKLFTDVGLAEERGYHSFPSGHASMGFYFMVPALLVYRRRGVLAATIFAGGLAYGGLIGVARIAQGAHFASDVLGSALCVWSAAVLVLAGRHALKRFLRRLGKVEAASLRLEPIGKTPGQRAAKRVA